jgi:hypothetical protein
MNEVITTCLADSVDSSWSARRTSPSVWNVKATRDDFFGPCERNSAGPRAGLDWPARRQLARGARHREDRHDRSSDERPALHGAAVPVIHRLWRILWGITRLGFDGAG